MLGVHVPALTGWTRQHPWMNMVLTSSYAIPLWQFAVAVPVLGIFLKDRRALWEYVANFHFCAIVTVAALALIPAECAFQHYGFTSTIDQARFIGHFNGFRSLGADGLRARSSRPGRPRPREASTVRPVITT